MRRWRDGGPAAALHAVPGSVCRWPAISPVAGELTQLPYSALALSRGIAQSPQPIRLRGLLCVYTRSIQANDPAELDLAAGVET